MAKQALIFNRRLIDPGLTGFIYAIHTDGFEFWKIGYSEHSPKQRLRTMQTGCPLGLVLFAQMRFNYAQTVEKALHRHLTADSVRGEWFKNTEAVRHIAELLQTDDSSKFRFLIDREKLARQKAARFVEALQRPTSEEVLEAFIKRTAWRRW